VGVLLAGLGTVAIFGCHKIEEGHVGVYYRGGALSTKITKYVRGPRSGGALRGRERRVIARHEVVSRYLHGQSDGWSKRWS
jgi:hypothetical protein